ncbi:MAG: 50S ribosomal protein L25 [Sporolactobacillus sp.]
MATLEAAIRDSSKKSVTHELRKEGKIPSVIYGKTVGNETVSVSAGEINKLFRSEGRNAVITLDVEGKKSYTVMAHELQYDHLKGSIQHIDFLEINLNETLDAVVPVELTHTEALKDSDAVLNHQLAELNVRALPNDLPSSIEIDVSKLAVGDSIRISDIAPESGYQILGDADDVIVSLSYGDSSSETETAAPEEAAPATDETPAE